MLDPTLARTFVGRIVFAALCDKLFDIDEKLNIVPQLATGYEWSADNKALTIKLRPGVTFHDGEKLDAAAVKFNIERHKTMPGSNRRGELAPVASVDVVDPLTVRLNLSAPFSPLLAQLADRAGMMVSPKAAQAAGDKFGTKPGVLRARSSSSSAWRRTASCSSAIAATGTRHAIHFDKVVYTPIPDATVRLANLQSGPARLHRARGAQRHGEARNGEEAQDRRASPRSATRASPSTSARASWRRKRRSAATPRVREALRAGARPRRASCRW